MKSKNTERQRGFTLIELMVAMVVALLLLAGILQILLGNRRSFDTAQTLAELQENARLVSFVVENAVAQAGYRVDLDETNDRLFPASSDDDVGPAYAEGAFIAARAGGANDDDMLRVRLRAAGGVHDCAGSEIVMDQDAGQAADTESRAAPSDFALAVEDETLQCTVFKKTQQCLQFILFKKCSASEKSRTVPLVNHVERFKVRYGLDTNGDDSVDRYTHDLSDDTAGQVRSLRIQTLLRSRNQVAPSAVSRHYELLGGTEAVYDDRYARVLLDQTIALRNALP